MKKIELVNLYEIVRKLDAKSIDSELRSKMLANTIIAKRVANEVEEAKKTVVEGITDEEKEANKIVQELQTKVQSDKEYKPSKAEEEAIEVVKAWNKTFADAINTELNTEAEVELKQLSTEEIEKLADGNSLTMDELVLISELLGDNK